ncbi:MAG TPA: glucoamylase family protein [Rhizomicrobium sp.]|nr:glucoamylase family protein [Rhizomicrobium sp.]
MSFLTNFLHRRLPPVVPRPPIRAELFSVERLEQHAESLAVAQRVAPRIKRGRPLAPRLDDNTNVLTDAYSAIVRATSAQQAITPAAEWLLDNFHIVNEQIREIKNDLPPGFYRMLPKLADGPLEGYPRVFGIAWALVAHTDSAFDIEKLTRFVEAYQRVEALTIGELWALAITLRVTLVENLRRLAEAIVARLAASRLADTLADGFLSADQGTSRAAVQNLNQAPWSTAFAVQLAQRLRDRDPEATPALRWLNEKLSAEGTTTDEIVREEVQRQSAMNVTVRNVITSMRFVSTINWAEFFESVSLVDAALRAASNFDSMDFTTRNLYRTAIEQLARQSGREETDVAEKVTAAVKSSGAAGETDRSAARRHDPGYYLIGQGRRSFEKKLSCRVPIRTRLLRLSGDAGVTSYVSMIAIATAIVLAPALLAMALVGVHLSALMVLGLAGLVPASDVGIALVNRAITRTVGATLLPGMELAEGVPFDLRTIIVVPTMLAEPAQIRHQVERLEVHYLSNSDENLFYALLSDWRDSSTQCEPLDETLLGEAAGGIKRLNARYPRNDGSQRFFLLHRRRLWNPGERKWIGWERKRGKLHELNGLLRGAADTNFVPIDDSVPSLPAGIRYVITLDADTRLPIGAARRLIGKMAHPLNRPCFDRETGLVEQGHGILQPRVTPSLPVGDAGSLYQRVFSGPDGLDPYALAVSDVYQDLFEEGSYSGKGIYEVDAFETALRGQIPENAVLSHDLLEGIFARAGLASDVEVVEEFPSRYSVAAARQHRWVRGDWQLLPWIFGFGHKLADGASKTKISLIGRWKLVDNLRRSLSAPATLLAFLIGWLQPMPAALIWTLFILLTIAVPPFIPALARLIPQRSISLRNHARALRRNFELGFLQSAFLLTFLAHQAWLMVDAVARTLSRLLIYRRRLLEWTTAAQSNDDSQFDARSLAAQISASLVFALIAGAGLYFYGQHAWPIATPFVALWSLSPLAARWASLPPAAAGQLVIAPDDVRTLRRIARRTWLFFEKFVTAEDNMLPPDNFQETPTPAIAHRTSPTNIGLYLLSAVAARDFGWLGTLDALERIEATVATMARMERFRGHFYNWYETRDVRPLEPKYVSSVDSGNLAGHLIATANACREMMVGPVANANWSTGIGDNLMLLREVVRSGAAEGGSASSHAGVETAIELVADVLRRPGLRPSEIYRGLDELRKRADGLAECTRVWSRTCSDAVHDEVTLWSEALRLSIAAHERDLAFFMPWAGLIASGEVPEEIIVLLDTIPALNSLPKGCEAALEIVQNRSSEGEANEILTRLEDALAKSIAAAEAAASRSGRIADELKSLAMAMEFGFLFNPERQLLSIGYRDADGNLDSNYYDLLASEARLASFIAIAKGDIPAKHWFHLGRTRTPVHDGSALISWSGSMFEYLMPSLVMRAPAGSLLEQTNRLVVRRQREYGHELGIPWGMSESEYNARDIEQTYQYSSFGVPDLGYKRGLAESTVIAPYASGLASMIAPAEVVQNYRRMAGLRACGTYGWYEAVDFTPARLPEGTKFAIVRAYMAHHQAMTIVGIANALHDGQMRARFHAEPIIQATELLLQERMPNDVALARPPVDQPTAVSQIENPNPEIRRRYTTAHSRIPRTQLLSNGRYSTMVTAAGSGYSRWHGVAITRWREDVTCDGWGSYVFLRDLRSGETWSAGYQPSAAEPDSYEAIFAEDRAEITRKDGTITSTLEIGVSPEHDAEVRRVSIANHGSRAREIEVTSYAELALARQADDVAHPAFSKLFVETEFVAELGAILATRRRRSSGDPQVWAAHLAVVEGEASGEVQFETDRSRFLGRGQTIRSAAAVTEGWPLSNTCGPVLDPIFSLRRRLTVPRGSTVRLAFWTIAAASRDEVMDLADKHHDAMAFERASTLAWTQAQMQLHHLGIGTDEAHLFQRLANHVLYSDATLRPGAGVLKRGALKVSTLWSQGISGDLPIVLVRVGEPEELELVRQLLRAHEYWRLKQLAVDLVIFNERPASYVQDLQIQIDALLRMNQSMPRLPGDDSRGAVFVLRADLVSEDVGRLLDACARAVLYGNRGVLAEQINHARDLRPASPPPVSRALLGSSAATPSPRQELEFFNGLGGFADSGREYVTILDDTNRTPAPWINVVANPQFGFTVSTDGSGFTWAVNSQQNQLTPWSNDPVGDAPGEVIYVRDEDTGDLWGPTALPIRQKSPSYTVRHGQGYSRFEHVSHGIVLEMLQFVPADDPVKITRLKVINQSARERRLSVTAYVEWVLGQNRAATAPFIITEIDAETGALFAQNAWNDQFGERVAFADLNASQSAYTGDRTEFIGRDGALDRPMGLMPGNALSNRVGAGLDPCGALQTRLQLAADTSTEIVFFLGQAATKTDAQFLVRKYRDADLDEVFAAVTKQWDDVLGTIQVKTPDPALDILLNRWLPYQILSCRIWARTGFYQASGAYGFRDQLQDVLALCLSRPDIARAHLLRAAARQFVEGDVQHWWLPESDRGLRTRVTDDRVWLAYAVSQYVHITGDTAVLSEMVPFLEGPALRAEDHDAFFQATVSERKASLFEHCALALDKSLATGAHGLPLMGAGDWNDGMDCVGEGGRGESIWLGWFLFATLNSFATLAQRHGFSEHAAEWRAHAEALRVSLEREAWDGDWYRRAFFDDGSPLGSVSNSECRIDSIAQSWAIISRGAEPARAARAMAALDKFLVQRDEKLSLLFTPPFDHPAQDPGYIKGYPPGIRENGGQYTHGALWAAQAFAMQGDGDRAGEMLAILNPIHHGDSPGEIHRYKVEPYVACADVYSEFPHIGRGGWTWYTGSAGWMYRVILEWLLGFRVQGSSLVLNPCIPRGWPAFEIIFRHRSAHYEITMDNPLGVSGGVVAMKIDGKVLTTNKGAPIQLLDDGGTHKVQIVLGGAAES